MTIAKDILKYIAREFFPPEDVLRMDDIILQKPASMNQEQLMLWIHHLLQRQAMVKRGEISTVFEFIPKPLVKANGKEGSKGQLENADSDAEELEIQAALDGYVPSGPSNNATLTKDDEDDDSTNSTASTRSTPEPPGDQDEDVPVEEEGIEPDSPASVGKDWTARVKFLRSLSHDRKYQELVLLLKKQQVMWVA